MSVDVTLYLIKNNRVIGIHWLGQSGTVDRLRDIPKHILTDEKEGIRDYLVYPDDFKAIVGKLDLEGERLCYADGLSNEELLKLPEDCVWQIIEDW